MKYCPTCGHELNENDNYCPNCGRNLNQAYQAPGINDTGSNWYLIAGLFVPLAGLILFLVMLDTRPKSAKKAGIGAIIGVVISIILLIVSLVVSLILLEYMNSDLFQRWLQTIEFCL